MSRTERRAVRGAVSIPRRQALSLALLLWGCDSSEGKVPSDDGVDSATGSVEVSDAGSATTDASAANGASSSPDATVQDSPVDASAPVVTDYEVAKTLVGSYAVRLKYRDLVTVGVAGSGSLVTTMFATAEIRDDAAAKEVRLEMTPCGSRSAAPEKHVADLVVTMEETDLAQTKLGPVSVRAMRSGDTTRWEVDELRGAAGWKPASPTDALPNVWDDPRILDQDGDGEPGVSADYGGQIGTTGHESGALYLAVAFRFRISGDLAPNGELKGVNTSSSQEALLGSSEPLLVLTGATIERKPEADPENNTARLTRLPSPLTCAQLSAQKETLFP
jgi:hypothetical protein